MVVPRLAKNGLCSLFGGFGTVLNVRAVHCLLCSDDSFLEYESGTKTVFDHFRNRHAR